MVAADPGYRVPSLTTQLMAPGASIEPEVMAGCIRCHSEPEAIAAGAEGRVPGPGVVGDAP